MNLQQELDLALSGVAQLSQRRSLFLLVALTMVASVRAPAWSAGVSDIIWLESNSTAGNSILAFQNNGSGTPTFLGSTPAGGIGVFDGTFALGPFDSDQNLIVNPEGTLLFAVNSGSNSIAVFHITSGGLEAVNGSPFPSGGSDPVSLGLMGDTLVVVNKDQDPAQSNNAAQPLTEPFAPAILPIGGTVPVRAQGIAVLETK